MLYIMFINWQPSLKGRTQEISEFDWFKLLAYGICTERYQYSTRNNHNGSKISPHCCQIIMPKIRSYVSYRSLYAILS